MAKQANKSTLPAPQLAHADIPRILVPDGLTFRDAAQYCADRADEEEQVAPFTLDLEVLPWSAAYAVQELLAAEYSATFSGRELTVPGRSSTVTVRWGTWNVAGLGELRQSARPSKAGLAYSAVLFAPRLRRERAEELLRRIRERVALRELYSGVALELRPDDDGTLDIDSPPALLPVPAVSPAELVLPAALEAAVRAEVLLPIRDAEALEAAGIPCRRGVLLAGRPGTGKTLTCRIAAATALAKGWTVFYLPDARALEAALRIAAAHAPALLIAEDLDRQLGGPRTAATDRILNALDGLDRSARIVVLATSNAPEALPAPLLRPGRLDSCLLFDLPDGPAALRLLELYLGARFPTVSSAELRELAGALDRLLPASVREVATRATLHACTRPAGERDIRPADILAAAASVQVQQRRLEAAELPPPARPFPELPVTIRHELPAELGELAPEARRMLPRMLGRMLPGRVRE